MKLQHILNHLVVGYLCFLHNPGVFVQSDVRINEIHYRNSNNDNGEFVEIAHDDVSIQNYRVILYNGDTGTSYKNSKITESNPSGFTVLPYASNTIQNGPDGFALVDSNGNLIEFLSYGGTFTAQEGPAKGVSSKDIGVVQNSKTRFGRSLQRCNNPGFNWTGPIQNTVNRANKACKGLPSFAPTSKPSKKPTSKPTSMPSSRPSSTPTSNPSARPSNTPTTMPSSRPSSTPTSMPSSRPSSMPSRMPSSKPTGTPTLMPSSRPSKMPTSKPSFSPTRMPSSRPSSTPTSVPSSRPSNMPTSMPSSRPSNTPTSMPSSRPSSTPTSKPSSSPTSKPSSRPSNMPTSMPSSRPFNTPTSMPSRMPSSRPSKMPTSMPSRKPTVAPTLQLTTKRINCGSTAAYTDQFGNSWLADVHSNGGSTAFVSVAIGNSNSDPIYQDYRLFGEIDNLKGYVIPVTPGSYTVRLHFAEVAPSVDEGERVFDILLQGILFRNDFDVFDAANGRNRATTLSTNVVILSSVSTLTVTFRRNTAKGNPAISGIEVFPRTS